MFWKMNSEQAEIKNADGREFKFGETTLSFSKPVPHGPRGSEIGFLIMLTVKTKGCTLVHASDVQGPMEKETLRDILEQKPDAVIAGGPPVYLQGFRVEKSDIEKAIENMKELAKKVPLLVMDHHLLRSPDFSDHLAPVKEEAVRNGNNVVTASELIGLEPNILEARRKELHAKKPVGREWYTKLEKGEFKEGF